MGPFNIFSKDLPPAEIPPETYNKPKPLIDFMKGVWSKGINIADRLMSIAHSLTPKDEPKPNNLARKTQTENKEANGATKESQNDSKSKHQIQEAIRKKYKPIPCWLDPSPRYDPYTLRSHPSPSQNHQQPEDFLEKHVAPRISIKKTVIIASPGNRGYMNVDKFLQRLKEIKAEKKVRQELKISRSEFTVVESAPLDPNVKGKSLMQLMNPDYKEERKLTPGEERQKYRQDFYSHKKSDSKPIVKGQMTEESSEYEEKSSTKDIAPVVQRERRDNSTIFESSSEDPAQNESEFESSQVPSSSKEVKAQNESKKEEKQQAQSVSATQQEKPNESTSFINSTIKQEQKPAQAISSVPQQQQQRPKFNPFLSALSSTSQQGVPTQLQIINTMEEMKKKLFGTTLNNTSQENHSSNNPQKVLPYFGTGQQNSFTSNLSPFNNSNKSPFFNSTSNPAQTTTPAMFSTQSSHQPASNTFTKPPSFQNLPNLTSYKMIPQQNPNYQQQLLSNTSNVPQLPFIKSTNHSFMNHGGNQGNNQNTGMSSFHQNNFTLAPQKPSQNQPQLASFLGSANKTPSFMAPHAPIPKNNPFGNHSSSTVFQSQVSNLFGQKPVAPLVKPNLLNDEKNKMVFNSFMAPSNRNQNKNQGLFMKCITIDNEDEWDRRTEKRGRHNTDNRRRERKQDRIRQ